MVVQGDNTIILHEIVPEYQSPAQEFLYGVHAKCYTIQMHHGLDQSKNRVATEGELVPEEMSRSDRG